MDGEVDFRCMISSGVPSVPFEFLVRLLHYRRVSISTETPVVDRNHQETRIRGVPYQG